MIEEAVEKVFAALVTPELIGRAERGEWPGELWRVVAASGFDRVLLPEREGGIGADWATALPVLIGLGRWQVPLPLGETIIARFLASVAGLEVPDGPLSVLVGTKAPWARCCKAIVAERDGRIMVAPIASVAPGANLAGEPWDTVTLREGVSGTLPDGHSLRLLAAFVRSAQLAGAMSSVLEQSVTYANTRVQFGRPIGKFQAVQQQLAEMAGEVVAARIAVEAAAASMSRFDIAVAKVRAGEAAGKVAAIGHAVHGAIGFTHEHRLHFATRRLWAWRAEFGTGSEWAAELGRSAIAAGAGGFWPSLTNRGIA